MRTSLPPAKSAQFVASLRPRHHVAAWPLGLTSLLAFSLLTCADAWVREAPVVGIEFRLPPPADYYTNLRQSCNNQQCLDDLENSTAVQSVPGYNTTIRPPPGYYAADALADNLATPKQDTLEDWNASFSSWLFLGCYHRQYDIAYDFSTNGAVRPGGISPYDGQDPYNVADSQDTKTLVWNPVNCTTACSSRNFSLAAIANGGLDCYCMPLNTTKNFGRSGDFFQTLALCSAECQPTYFNGTRRYCGAEQTLFPTPSPKFYYSLYRVYDNIHGTSHGTLDPMRNIWYIAVTLERTILWDTDYGNISTGFDYFLHASSTVSGDPMFPFHIPLDGPHYGLQYDLDNSSVLGYELPNWPEKGRPPAPIPPPADGSPAPAPTNYWYPVMYRYEMDSGTPSNVFWYPKDRVGSLPTEEAIFINGVTCLDSVFGIYYIVIPNVQFPFNDYGNYNSKIIGFDLGNNADEVMAELVEHEVVSLAADNRDHTLYGLFLHPGNLTFKSCFLFFRLGHSKMQIIFPTNPFDPIITVVTFQWTLTGKSHAQVIPSHDLFWNTAQNLTRKYYQINSLALDAEENVTFILYKDSPHMSNQWNLKDVDLRNRPQDLLPKGIVRPPQWHGAGVNPSGVAAMMISNPDPIIPWFRPRLEYIRFHIDGMMVELKMQNFTMGGVQPYDINGDILPDKVDWEKNQFGPRNCSDMLGPNVSEYLGDMPNVTWVDQCGPNGGDISSCHPSLVQRIVAATCEWYYNDTIRIHFCCDPELLLIGDPTDLKNQTIFGFLAGLDTWTFSAYGVYPVAMPTPLIPPEVEIFSLLKGVANMDLTFNPKDDVPMCSNAAVDARNSYFHGGTPYWTWSVSPPVCEFFDAYGFTGNFAYNHTLFMRLKEELANKSVGSTITYKERGYKQINFPDHGLLEPGCTYNFRIHLRGRWGLSIQKDFTIVKEGPPAVDGWLPSCDYHCNFATCEDPNQCLMMEPGPLVGPMIPGEKVCFCDEFRYGLFCRGICPDCSPYRTNGCDDGRMGSGNCKCKVGWDGRTCEEKLEFWKTDWSECTPCGVPVGTQSRNYECTNLQKLTTVNASRCPGPIPVAKRNCQPPLCPCGPPPAIPGGDNTSTSAKCAVVKSGSECYPVCNRGFIPTGRFYCYSSNYVEMGACVDAGNQLQIRPGVHMSVKVRVPEISPEMYLSMVELTLMMTVAEIVRPVVVIFEGDNSQMKVTIKVLSPFGANWPGRFAPGELTAGNLPGQRRLQAGFEGVRNSIANSTTPSNTSTWTKWKKWLYGLRRRSARKNGPEREEVSMSTTPDPVLQLKLANFNGHRASGFIDLPIATISDRASSSIATRLQAILKDAAPGFDSPLPRRLAANYSHFELSVVISFPTAVEQQAALQGLTNAHTNPTIFENTFIEKYYIVYPHCSSGGTNASCQGLPDKWDLTAPQLTQVYVDTGLPVNLTTTTLPPAPTPYPPPEESSKELVTGISLGVSIGLCAVCMPLLILGICHYQKKHRVRLTPIEDIKPDLPPGPPRHWEMPESAKITDDNGAPLTGHTKREWQGGGTYEGQVIDGMRAGNGRMEWPNGKCYAGQWLYGRPHGHGLLHAPGERGWTYNGQFQDGQRDGVGRCESFARKMWYDGEWKGGLQNGMGENGNLPTLPGDLGSNVLPPPVAHIWWMEQGDQNEHVSISKVAPESRDLIGLALDAVLEDWERMAGEDYSPGGKNGPPPSPLQDYSRLWGICFGATDAWLPTCWGALIITRIMEDGALARWNMWQVRDFGSNANEIHPNALIWRVNGVEGDVEKMAEELRAEESRHRLQLAVSNPPHIRFPKQTGLPWNKRPSGARGLIPAPSQQTSLFMRQPALPTKEPGPPPKIPALPSNRASFTRGTTPPLGTGDLRALAHPKGLPELANLALGGLPPASHKPPQTPFPGQQQSLPALPNLPRSRDLSSLPALPNVKLPPHPSKAPPAPRTMPPVQLAAAQPHLSTLSLPPAPSNVPKAPPGRPRTPGGPPVGMPGMVIEPGPPPKKAPPPRIGYREVAAVRQIAHLGNQHPNPPG